MAYVSLSEVRNWLGIPDTGDDPELQMALDAACKRIDQACHQRFEGDVSATARLFVPTDCGLVRLRQNGYWSVIGDTTDMVVKTDDNEDGTFETTWVSTDFQTYPLSGVGNDGTAGWPIYELRAYTTGPWWPISYSGRPLVQVTARWGWAAVPTPIKLAATLLTAAWHQRRATMTGRGGFDGMFASAVDDDPTIADLLEPYRRRARAVVG